LWLWCSSSLSLFRIQALLCFLTVLIHGVKTEDSSSNLPSYPASKQLFFNDLNSKRKSCLNPCVCYFQWSLSFVILNIIWYTVFCLRTPLTFLV
jgi:hypothetical protein